jgi:thiamine kinase-like enzyme
MVSVCRDLYTRYAGRTLLHADLHGDNLLKRADGDYVIVDPHARVGPPICDLGRYIANEYADAAISIRSKVIEVVINRLSELLELPQSDIIRAFFVDMTLMTCWDAEDILPNIDGVKFAMALLLQIEK